MTTGNQLSRVEELVGKTIESVKFVYRYAVIKFDDGDFCAFSVRELYDDGPEVCMHEVGLDHWTKYHGGLLTDKEFDELNDQAMAARQRRVEAQERAEFARLREKYGESDVGQTG